MNNIIRCERCGRVLKTEESIKNRMGKICKEKIKKEIETERKKWSKPRLRF